MMTFIDDEMPIVSHKVRYLVFSDQALDDGNVDNARRTFLTTADNPDAICADCEERAQPRQPLIQQLLPMDQYQGIHFAFRDEFDRDHRFSECRRSGEHARIVSNQVVDSGLLFLGERPEELRLNWHALLALIAKLGPDAAGYEEVQSAIQASSGQCNVSCEQLGTRNYARFTERRQSHRLGSVELGILKGSKTD